MSETSKISIRYDDIPYKVSPGRTILTALEEAGRDFVRGIGCRGGVCGACTILYRIKGKPEFIAALICQDEVEEGMEILPLPYIPQKKVQHDLVLGEGETPEYLVRKLYPEVNNCVMCGECTRLCPVDIDVMSYVGMIKRGDLAGAAHESFTCIQCQACVLRCPSQISQPNAALAARRFQGRFKEAPAEHLSKAVEKMQSGHYKSIFRRLSRLDPDDLRALYQRREREPDNTHPGTWLPQDRSLL
ncbi:MAG: 4Fe-4S dicluster domain-containing protein [Magnetococcales bacterium]|nr:4Fe-4S dicluster domain-containing protein [Magnetococcales bacterium]